MQVFVTDDGDVHVRTWLEERSLRTEPEDLAVREESTDLQVLTIVNECFSRYDSQELTILMVP